MKQVEATNQILEQVNKKEFIEGRQFVTFILEDEEYGVDIVQVQEIIGYKKPTLLPNVASFIKGVINLRGNVIPVVDVREKFRMSAREVDASTVVMIIEVEGKTMGMIVDGVSDVVMLDDKDIQPTPQFTSKINTEFIRGMGRKNKKFIILLDIDQVLSERELEAFNA